MVRRSAPWAAVDPLRARESGGARGGGVGVRVVGSGVRGGPGARAPPPRQPPGAISLGRGWGMGAPAGGRRPASAKVGAGAGIGAHVGGARGWGGGRRPRVVAFRRALVIAVAEPPLPLSREPDLAAAIFVVLFPRGVVFRLKPPRSARRGSPLESASGLEPLGSALAPGGRRLEAGGECLVSLALAGPAHLITGSVPCPR